MIAADMRDHVLALCDDLERQSHSHMDGAAMRHVISRFRDLMDTLGDSRERRTRDEKIMARVLTEYAGLTPAVAAHLLERLRSTSVISFTTVTDAYDASGELIPPYTNTACSWRLSHSMDRTADRRGGESAWSLEQTKRATTVDGGA